MADQKVEKRKRGRPRNTFPNAPDNTVQALDRGLVVLGALADLGSATLSDIANHVDMPASTVHRILGTLQKHSFADFETTQQEWAIGIGAFKVGSTYLARSNLIEASLKVMRPLMEQTGETANLGIAEAGKIIFISQVETKNPVRAMFRQGTGSPMHASGIGKAILAGLAHETVEKLISVYGQPTFTPRTITTSAGLFEGLEQIRCRGWAFDDEERYLGMRCVAAAVYDMAGKPVAGLSISGPSARFGTNDIGRFGQMVIAAANDLMAITGGVRPR